MSVNNGDKANAETFNSGFLSRTNNSGTIARVSLLRPGSGDSITDTQQQINDNKTLSETNQQDIVTLNDTVTNLANSLPLSNFAATTNPGASNDNTEGYQVGSRWINTTLDRIYEAVDVSTGAAIWKRTDKVELAVKNSLVLDFATNPVNDAGFTEISADIGPDRIKRIQSFYPDGDPATIAIGASGSETQVFILTPGGNAEKGIDVDIPANSRLSIRLLSGGAANTQGKMILNLLGEL